VKTWFPIVGAPAAWGIQGLLLWLAASWGCSVSGPVRGIVITVSAVTFAIALAALFAAGSGWRGSGRRQFIPIEGETRPDFTAAVALLVSITFLVAVVATALPIFMLSACEPMR
jgi:hypothetical protein